MALPMGLTSTGLQIPTQQDVIDDITERVHAAFSTTLDASAHMPLGQFIAIFAEVITLVCELLQVIYSANDPDAALGDALEILSKLTGTLKNPAEPSTVTLTLTGTPATVVALGSRAANSLGTEFKTDAAATITLLSSWTGSTSFAVGIRRTNASRCYVVITAGTSASSGGPTTTASDITDGTVHWRYLGEGTGAIDAASTATVTGPLVGTSGTITTIVTPVSGWSSVVNLLDADLGANIESDEFLRARREEELADAGSTPIDAARALLSKIKDVKSVVMFQNVTDVTVDTIPPHSVEALVRGGTNQDIFNALLIAVAAGIRSHGTTTGTATDEEGTVHAVAFTRPTEIAIWVIVNIDVDALAYPADGNDQVEAAIVKWGDALKTGYNVHSTAVGGQAFTVPGVLQTTSVLIGTSNPPTTSTSIPIAIRELAVFDTSRITVTATPVTP